MLLVIDVGNTNTVLGIYRGEELVDHWRIETRKGRTADEHGMLLLSLLQTRGISPAEITATVVSCVVPSLLQALDWTAQRYLGHAPMVVGPGIRTGMAILVDNPRELGADRIVNCVAAYEKYKTAMIVVDFGTATTFDCVSKKGEYIGGAIAPGFAISAEALFRETSKLPRVELARPRRVIGKNTIDHMQSGLFYGYAGLVDGLVTRLAAEMGLKPKVVATGGLAGLIAEAATSLEVVDAHLTLDGLRMLWERNQEP